MVRSLLAVVLALAACDEAKQKADKAVDTVKNNSAVQKVDKALDNLDLDEVKAHLSSAKDAIGRGLEAAEDCAYAARIADDVVKNAPLVEDHYFVVPKVVE